MTEPIGSDPRTVRMMRRVLALTFFNPPVQLHAPNGRVRRPPPPRLPIEVLVAGAGVIVLAAYSIWALARLPRGESA